MAQYATPRIIRSDPLHARVAVRDALQAVVALEDTVGLADLHERETMTLRITHRERASERTEREQRGGARERNERKQRKEQMTSESRVCNTDSHIHAHAKSRFVEPAACLRTLRSVCVQLTPHPPALICDTLFSCLAKARRNFL